MRTTSLAAALAAATVLSLAPAPAHALTKLRGVLLIDFGAGISNPMPSTLTFTVPAQLAGRQDLNQPPNGKPGLQIPTRCRGTFTVDLSGNASCNQLGGLLRGSTAGGRALVRLETPNRKLGGVFESAVTSGADCSLFEGNVTSGTDPFEGDLECATIGEAFVWQAQINATLSSTVPSFFGIDPARTNIVTKVFNIQRTADSGIGVNNSSVEVRFKRP